MVKTNDKSNNKIIKKSNDSRDNKAYELDFSSVTPREANQKLKEIIREHNNIIIKNPNAMHYLVAGVIGDVKIEIDGSAGYFVGTMINKAKLKINGNVGWFAGDNMTGGEIIIDGSAGDGAGQGIYDGTLVVRKNAGSRTGEIMKNGTIIIGGDSGFMSGIFMMGGRIIVLGDLGKDAGESIIRGTIYVRGSVSSLGQNAKLLDIDDNDKKELKTLLSNYDFVLDDDDYDKFRKIVPKSKRPFYGHDEEEENCSCI
ncbi:GltB/FmdC/FwdC-like GXGXG domain-containing protein [Methanobrevibacter cuticularis]|nr:GXGXG domain-containing protein [Methanobrevibacter cuticularis]